MCLALHITPDKPAGWEYSVFIFLCIIFVLLFTHRVFLSRYYIVYRYFSRQFGFTAADIRWLHVDVHRGQNDAPRHRNPMPTPVAQRIRDGLADEPAGSHGRRVLGAHHRSGTAVVGRIQSPIPSKSYRWG